MSPLFDRDGGGLVELAESTTHSTLRVPSAKASTSSSSGPWSTRPAG